jgi:hypothetical protein
MHQYWSHRHRTEGDHMTAAARTRRNARRAATRTSYALYYRTLSGIIAAHVEAGRLIKTGDFLQRIGGGELKDGVKSWFGRHVAKAYRAANGGDAVKVWARHRTTGRWIHVYAYGVVDEALYEGLFNYRGTQHLLASNYAEAA